MTDRISKILLSTTVGMYLLAVVFNNVTDYNSNFQFVHMVAKMEDTFSYASNGWRSIQHPAIHHLMYIFIIIWEFSIMFLLLRGAYQMLKSIHTSAEDFKKSKSLTSVGLTLGVVLWFFVFITVGGEWFLMWQSSKWNAQTNAFFLSCCFLLFLIFHNQET